MSARLVRLNNDYLHLLLDHVNARLADGWTLHGTMFREPECAKPDSYTQLMLRPDGFKDTRGASLSEL